MEEERDGRGKRSRPATPPTQAPKLVEEEETYQEDMEKFYALLRNIRALRELLRSNDAGRKRSKSESSLAQLWRPSFELGDFKEWEEHGTRVENAAINPLLEEGEKDLREEENEVEVEGNTMDLRLSL